MRSDESTRHHQESGIAKALERERVVLPEARCRRAARLTSARRRRTRGHMFSSPKALRIRVRT
jgi:hypothetical protein